MDPARDNPISRFTGFWLALSAFLVVGLLLVLVMFFNRGEPASLEVEAAKARYDIRAKVDAAQAAVLKPEAIEQGMQDVAGNIVTWKAAVVAKPEQIVPNSPRAKKLAAAAPVDVTAIDKAVETNAPINPAAMALGKGLYGVCSACHGLDAAGTPAAPPLAGSEWVKGPVSNVIRIQLRGLTGPITVKGKEYNIPNGMAHQAAQTDDQIAAVLTYVRNSFGNKASAVTADQVKALRSEVGKPQLTQADLVKP
ncbi:MAG: c-type cytochrome [Verrucomicrobiota bacterium]